MILHFFENQYFVDSAIEKFEAAAPKENVYIIDARKPTEALGILKRKDMAATYDFNRIWENIESLRQFEFVVVHGFSANSIRIIAKAPPDIKFVWAPWGGEIYSRMPEFVDSCNVCENDNDRLREECDYLIKRHYTPFTRHAYEATRLAYSKLRMCIMGFEMEYRLFQSRMQYLKAEWMPWAYHPLPDDHEEPRGRNILVGNSASPVNNHQEILEMLSRFPLGDRQIIVPLSYGGKDYAEDVAKRGKELLGDRFRPLMDYMPLDEYKQIMLSCNAVIMNHVQERGFGNVMIALTNGMDVFLRPDGMVAKLLASIGVRFFTTTELNAAGDVDALKLTDAEKERNREILRSYFSPARLVEETRDIIEKMRKMA